MLTPTAFLAQLLLAVGSGVVLAAGMVTAWEWWSNGGDDEA